MRIAKSRIKGVARRESCKTNKKRKRNRVRTTYLAFVENVDGGSATAEDLRVILVDGPLGVADGGNVLDNYNVVWMLALTLGTGLRSLEQQPVRVDHVIHDAALADLLAPELPLRRKVMAIVVTKMVVRRDGQRLDTGINEKLSQNRLELGLARLEIVATDERLFMFGELDDTRNEGVLGSTVDERFALENRSDGEDRRRGNFRVRGLDSVEDVLGGVVDAGNEVAVAFGVGSPEDDDTVEAVVLLKLANVGTDMLKMGLLVGAWDEVVRARLLVRSDEVGVVDGRERFHLSQVGSDLALKIVVENTGSLHRFVQRQARDVPTTKNEVIGVHHGQHIGHWDVNVLASGGLSTNANGRSTKEGTNVVGLLDTRLCVPGDIVTVGKNSRTQSGTIVSPHTDHHQTGKEASET